MEEKFNYNGLFELAKRCFWNVFMVYTFIGLSRGVSHDAEVKKASLP